MVSIIPISLSMNDSFDTVLIFRFDEFILIRQAILLTIDTFGFSHILPIFGLPFLVACQYRSSKKQFILVRLSQVSSLPGCVCFSHILPIFGLPFLVACQYRLSKKRFILVRLSQVSSLPGCVCHVFINLYSFLF